METGELLACADGYTPVAAQGTEYVDEWVFNIGDFVDYLWTLDNGSAYNIKVRFYPLSEQAWWPLPDMNWSPETRGSGFDVRSPLGHRRVGFFHRSDFVDAGDHLVTFQIARS